ncbi:hypothetical protein MTR67_024727 [Solanum verrucosum]|uniref:Uncharacterized protein n=1 Tax=Solanum verrucosum TaxID=315347 RepID=A0AAF0TSI1_SOLVR|nr:hypothetical protein MTR67_024727 [Solanum verrucosum]
MLYQMMIYLYGIIVHPEIKILDIIFLKWAKIFILILHFFPPLSIFVIFGGVINKMCSMFLIVT